MAFDFPTGARRLAASVFALAAALSFSGPARAVTILDETWRQEGGAAGREWAGFGAHLKLAAEPQFKAVLAFATDGETWGEASGTWIGNESGHAFILTAAHIFNLPAKPDAYVVRAPSGRILHADRVWVHPQWTGDTDTRTGYDLAILRLTEPVLDAGPPPALYRGSGEKGRIITFVGFGSRGVGSTGEAAKFYRGSDKAAAEGVVDQWVDIVAKPPAKGDGGNYLGVFLPKRDGSIPNPYGGKAVPATRLAGLLGSGDSGGSAWMPSGDGWVIVAVNSNGSGTAAYGDTSWFVRVSPHLGWIGGIFPGVRISD